MSATTTVAALADLARAAARTLTVATGAERAAALNAIADEIESRSAEILAANKVDIDRGIAEGMHPQLQDRLLLTAERVKGIASGARQVAALEDPLGNVLRERTLPNGLHLKQISVPFGVIGMVYEARPNVTVDAAVIWVFAPIRHHALIVHVNFVLGPATQVKLVFAIQAAVCAQYIQPALHDGYVLLMLCGAKPTKLYNVRVTFHAWVRRVLAVFQKWAVGQDHHVFVEWVNFVRQMFCCACNHVSKPYMLPDDISGLALSVVAVKWVPALQNPIIIQIIKHFGPKRGQAFINLFDQISGAVQPKPVDHKQVHRSQFSRPYGA